MRRLLALATLLVLSLSRFGAPAPAHARTWVVDRVTSELGAAVPGARLAAPAVRELAQRDTPRAPLPWLPIGVASANVPSFAFASVASPRFALEHAPADGWHRFTYDATAPPRLS
jgi:hypothetical protein